MKDTIYVGKYASYGINLVKIGNDNIVKDQQIFGDEYRINPYICKYKDCLYCVEENRQDEKQGTGYAVAYKCIGDSISFLNRKITYGEGPCYVTVDPKRELLYVCNYSSGSFVIYSLKEDGSIGEKLFFEEYPNGSILHHLQLSNDFNYLLVTDLAKDKIIEYEIIYDGSKMTLRYKSEYRFAENTQPRHIAIDKNDNIYVVTEKSCELYKFRNNYGKLELIQKCSILMENIAKEDNYTGSAIKIDSDSHFMYIPVRGHNSISVFDISEDTIRLVQSVDSHGERTFDATLNHDGTLLVCANYASNNISIFSIKDGLLKFESDYNIEHPTCICLG